MAQKRRKVFNIKEKFDIISRLENGELNGDIAKACGISHSTISMIWKSKDKIKAHIENKSLKVKRLRTSEHRDIEEALLEWFKHQRANKMPISGPILQQKANDFARHIGKENFACSSSWVQRFRARYNIGTQKECSNTVGVTEDVTEEWLSLKWPALSEGYKSDEIYYADETGLFFNINPDISLKFKGEPCKDRKMPERRNADEAMKSRCISNISSIPITLENKTKTCMKSHIFEKWLRNWDADLKSTGSKIILLVHSSPAHPVVPNLSCIKLVFLPNGTTVLQPMDQEVIKTLQDEDENISLPHLATESRVKIEDLVCTDDNIINPVTEENILSEVENNHGNSDIGEIKREQKEQFRPTTLAEAIHAVTTLQSFLANNKEFTSDHNNDVLQEMKHKMQNAYEMRKQTKITDYFNFK